MLFTPTQIDDLLRILDKYTITFLARHVGADILSKEDISLLEKTGVDFNKFNLNDSNVLQAFKFGLLSDAVGDKNAKNMSYNDFKKFLESGKFIELSELEKKSITSLKYQTYGEVKKLGDGIKNQIRQELVFADKKNNTVKHAPSVTQAAQKAIEHRKGVSYMVSELGHMTKKWDTDLGRISDFVLHTAFDEGRAAGFKKRNGNNALVFKDVYPGACKHCIKAYLTAGISSAPKIFTLNELEQNGTNVGKKVEEWLPVIGPLHPWCRCTLDRVPLGFTLEDYNKGAWKWEEGNFVRNKEVEIESKRKQYKVTVNNKEMYV